MLIAIEGVDGSGKATQARKLEEMLQVRAEGLPYDCGQQPRLLDFPAYDRTYFGPRTRDYLRGRMGKLNDNNPFLVSLLYALDRFECKAELIDAADTGILICDRYVPSNIAHQCAKVYSPDNEDWAILAGDIQNVEYDILGLPVPDLVIYLDLTAEQSYRRTHARDDVKDLHQDDTSYMAAVREVYLCMTKMWPKWHLVAGFEGERERPVAEIHAEICEIVREVLAVKE